MFIGRNKSGVCGLLLFIAVVSSLVISACSGGSSSNGGASADVIPPTAGTNVTISGVTYESIRVSWDAATDNTAKSLEYKIVYSTLNNISTVADALANGTVAMDWTADVTSKPVTGLAGSTRYYVAVLVRDAAGNISIYTTQNVTTPAQKQAPAVGTDVIFSDVGVTQITATWGAASDEATPANGLEYKLVFSTLNNLSSVEDAENNGTTAMDWTAGTLTYQVTELAMATTYYFAVIVKDGDGLKALYTPQTQTTAEDPTAPVAGDEITTGEVTSSGFAVMWGAATDAYTGQSSLRYKVVYSTSNNLSTIDDANNNGTVALNWTANVTSTNITGLTNGTAYYVAVLVEDLAGNTSLYTPRLQATLDTTAPVIGTSIQVSNLKSSSLSLSWGAASDNTTSAANLMYKVVYSTADNLTSLTAADSATAILDWSFNTLAASVSALTDNTQYYFAVIVKDAAGNKALYPAVNVTTPANTAPTPGTGITITSNTAHSIGFSWGAATDDSADTLRYKAVVSTTAISSIAEAEAASVVMNWTESAVSATAAGLEGSTTYYIAVLVRDASGGTSMYPAVVVTTADTIAPVSGTGITFSSITSSGATLTWGAATDNLTPQADLSYKVVKTSDSSEINSIAEAEALSGTDIVMDWSTNALTADAAGLASSTMYVFAVLVKDAAGNKALYPQASVTTLDGTPPAVPDDAPVVSSISQTSLTFTWAAAFDDITSVDDLQYKLVYSLSDNISTPEDAEANGTVSMNWTAGALTYDVTGLVASTTYYFTVLVKDEAGNIAAYSTVYTTTAANTHTLTYDGNGADGGSLPSGSVYTEGAIVSIPSATPTRTGHTFVNWNTAANGSGSSYSAGATFIMGSSNITLYAQWTAIVTTYAIGDLGPSGVGRVFYITDGGVHGLEAAPATWFDADGDPTSAWSNVTGTLIGTTGTTIGSGANNTNAIIAQTGHTTSAALLCRNYHGGGKTDWFLPSLDELNQMYIQSTNPTGGFVGNFTADFYWSSSESSSIEAWEEFMVIGMFSGVQMFYGKGGLLYVRPIRAF